MTIWSYGIAMIDVVLQPVDAWPDSGGLIICDTGTFIPGGVGLNTAVTIARLGGTAALVGALGKDAVGRAVVTELDETGVRADGIVYPDGVTTGFCVVGVARSGERSLAAHLGANAALSPEQVRWDLMQPGDHLHVGGIFGLPQLRGEGLMEVLERARGRGMSTSTETTWDVSGQWLEGISESLPFVDVFMTNEVEAAGMTGGALPDVAAASLARLGPRIVIVKAGEDGCYVHAEGVTTHFPAYLVAVTDTTGAGDCFCGGFLYARDEGRSIEDAARFANAVGALTCMSLGATKGIPEAGAVESFMRTTELQ